MAKVKITITKKIMEQYEIVRRSGATNMYDYQGVVTIADRMELYSLASLEKEDYVKILTNFGKLMKKYNIKQDKEQK